MSPTDSAHAACENCNTALQGHYCHRCGQSAHNPLKHVGHAIEEVFESFWHLDGRIFRSLRDLCIPGRIALNYLNGRRVGYVQPLRLFVSSGGGRDALFARATTVEKAGLGTAFASPTFSAVSSWLYALLWLAVPIYLLWMQQRVYGGNKVLTLVRYLIIGGIYLCLVSFVVMYATLAGISA